MRSLSCYLLKNCSLAACGWSREVWVASLKRGLWVSEAKARLQDARQGGQLRRVDCQADMKQGSCQEFRRKHDRIRGRGHQVGNVIVAGPRPSIWPSSCGRPEKAGTRAGPSTRPRGPRNAQGDVEGGVRTRRWHEGRSGPC